MIESIEFTNFKALRKTGVTLAPFTLLLGPNGSGKTSLLQAIGASAAAAAQRVGRHRQEPVGFAWESALSVTATEPNPLIEIKLRFREKNQISFCLIRFQAGQIALGVMSGNEGALPPNEQRSPLEWLSRMQVYSLDPVAIAQPAPVNSEMQLQPNGGGLAAVMDDLKDNQPELWEMLLAELCQWLPEYDNVLFDKPGSGMKAIVLRTKKGQHRIPAKDLSQGTLIALTLLTLAYLPEPPSLIGLEEIDRGLHPRLLRQLQDALYRLSYPDSTIKRPPIQVIATTHSPYLLDLYRDHPEEVVLARKEGLEVKMETLKEIKNFEEILGDAPLSEVWYSGVLGGVSVKP